MTGTITSTMIFVYRLKNNETTKEINLAATAEQEKRIAAAADKKEPVQNTEAAVETSKTTSDRVVKEIDEKQPEIKIK